MGYPTKITDFSDLVSMYDDIKTPSRHAFGQTYHDNHVFDENQSVKWNREEVKRRNAEAVENYKNALADYDRQLKEFWIDVDKYLANEFKLSLEAAHEFRLVAWKCDTVECDICCFQTFLEDFHTCYMQIWEDKK